MTLLSYQLLEKLIYGFYSTCYGMINDEILPKYFNGEERISSDLVEDALFNLTGMIGKV